MAGPSSPTNVWTKLQRVAELSRERPEQVWTTLAHHIDQGMLRSAFERARKSSAPGVDGQTVGDYASNLDANLASLHDRFRTGAYRAPPVRRVYIPKPDGRMRPIGIPTLEDKILQRAVAWVMEAVYEQDFMDCSYGFRPGRSAHQALEALRKMLMATWGGYVVELDIVSFFDAMDHATLRSFLDKRIRDGVIRRAIGKWLKAGVLEDGEIHRAREGSPQGGVISPLLANIYLHEVLDLWFERDVKPRMRGQAGMVRYADDAVLVFERESDARRVMAVLPKRFAKFGLKLHPEKTRLIRFESPEDEDRGSGTLGTFSFLGFTHYWGKNRRGKHVIKRKTDKSRLRRSLATVTDWCRRNCHLPVREQHRALTRKMLGHYGYYGITGNIRALTQFYERVRRIWRHWLSRRSHRAHLDWETYVLLLRRYPLPKARIVHR